MAFTFKGHSEETKSFEEKPKGKFTFKGVQEETQQERDRRFRLPTDEEREEMKYPYGVGSFVAENPKEALLGIPIAGIEGLESIAGSLFDLIGSPSENVHGFSDFLKEKAGIKDLPEEAETEASLLNLAGNIVPYERLAALGTAKAAKGIQNLRTRSPRVSPSSPPSGTNWRDSISLTTESPVRKGEIQPKFADLTEEAKPLNPSRVSAGGRNLEVSPPKLQSTAISPLEEELGSIASKQKFSNATTGGKAIQKEVMELDRQAYQKVNDLYKRSRELNREIEAVHPQLVEKLENRLVELREIPEPSGPQKQLIGTLENILKRLGSKSGYRPISNQTLIDQVQSLRQKIDYDFAHGNASNIFRPVINDLQDAVTIAAKKNPEALEAINAARKEYASWADAFDNPYIRPLRDKSNKDYTKIFKASQDFDEFNQLKDILERSAQGKVISSGVKREVLLKRMRPIVEKEGRVAQREIEDALHDLEAVFSPEEISSVRSTLSNAQQPIPKRIWKKVEEGAATKSDLELVASKLVRFLPIGYGPKKVIQMLLDPKTRKALFNLARQNGL